MKCSKTIPHATHQGSCKQDFRSGQPAARHRRRSIMPKPGESNEDLGGSRLESWNSYHKASKLKLNQSHVTISGRLSQDLACFKLGSRDQQPGLLIVPIHNFRVKFPFVVCKNVHNTILEHQFILDNFSVCSVRHITLGTLLERASLGRGHKKLHKFWFRAN